MRRLLVGLLLAAAPAAGAQQRSPPSLGALAAGSPALPAVPPEERADRPPLSGDIVIGQVFAGALGGVVGAAGLGLGWYAAGRDGPEGWGGLEAVVVGLAFGYPLGAAGGVYLIGGTGGRTGSPWATLAGAAAGAGAGALLGAPTGGLSYLVLAPAGAAAGFNLTRRYRAR